MSLADRLDHEMTVVKRHYYRDYNMAMSMPNEEKKIEEPENAFVELIFRNRECRLQDPPNQVRLAAS